MREGVRSWARVNFWSKTPFLGDFSDLCEFLVERFVFGIEARKRAVSRPFLY
jgi:hypothetical protein